VPGRSGLDVVDEAPDTLRRPVTFGPAVTLGTDRVGGTMFIVGATREGLIEPVLPS
jgi:hypothetical protein